MLYSYILETNEGFGRPLAVTAAVPKNEIMQTCTPFGSKLGLGFWGHFGSSIEFSTPSYDVEGQNPVFNPYQRSPSFLEGYLVGFKDWVCPNGPVHLSQSQTFILIDPERIFFGAW